jgi:hypothetical protein
MRTELRSTLGTCQEKCGATQKNERQTVGISKEKQKLFSRMKPLGGQSARWSGQSPKEMSAPTS